MQNAKWFGLFPPFSILYCAFSIVVLLWAGLASAQAAGAFALTWQYTQDPVNQATSFSLQRCIQTTTGCSMGDLAGATQIPLTTLSYTDATITQNVTFCYRIAAGNTFGRSPYSSTICGKLGAPPGTSPSNVQLNIVNVP